jgi:hypothetical protein
MIDQSQYEDLLVRARKRFQLAVEAEKEIRASALEDLDFLAGDQWDAKVKADRERGPSPRPCLVFNKVLPPVTQLGNQARQNKPSIKVSPVDSKGDPDTAKVFQGLVRHIEYDSDADQAYDTALFYAAGCSFGYWRYGCERILGSFDQELKTITVDDPFSIYLDSNARKPDRSDMKWAFVIDKMANDTYEARFGKETADLNSDFLTELEGEGWRDGDERRVAEYWEVETEKKTLRMRKDPDGTVHGVYLEDLAAGEEEGLDWVLEDEDDPASTPLEAEDELPVVMQYIINGSEVLEEPTRWDGSTIPIVIVTGLEMVVRGKKKIFSMTRFARDPQQLLNFYKTMEAETIALAPKPKYVGAVGQFKTKRRDWQRANTDNGAILEYDMVAVGDKQAPEPQWRTFDPPVQALSIGAAAAIDDIKASTGYYDPSLGQQKGDQSGVAIGKLVKQGDVSNFHFLDNQARGFKRGGRILVELIPKKYDTAREIRIIGEDKKQEIIKINQPGIDKCGKPYHHILGAGKYDVVVEQGPSYDTQRDQTREMIMALAQGNPEVWQLAADIFFENQDFVGADRLAKRFHAVLPPAILQQEDSGDANVGQLQAQVAQLSKATQELQQANQQMQTLLQTKILDLESKERIATQSNQTKAYVAEATSKSAAVNQLAQQDHARELAALDARASLLRSQMDIEAAASADAMEHQQQQQQKQQAQQHAQQMQGADQAHEQGMAAQQQAADQQAQQTAQQQPPAQPAAKP